LRAILDETAVLARLIEDLRTLSVAEAGALALHREPTDLGALARDVAASFEPQAQTVGVSVETSAAPGLPEADVDPVRVREILTNLISNALRYSPRGGRVGVDVAADGAGAVAVAVSDVGPGITPEMLGRIFDRFYKSPESRGAGLGLAIAKNLTEAHGGTIAATSEVGRGPLSASRCRSSVRARSSPPHHPSGRVAASPSSRCRSTSTRSTRRARRARPRGGHCRWISYHRREAVSRRQWSPRSRRRSPSPR